MSNPTKTPERNTALTRNAISTFGIVVLVLSVASPLIGLTGAVPSAMVLGNGLGVPLAYVAVGAILLLFSIGFVAMSRQVTNAGALYAYVGRGLGIPMGLGAAGLALWAYTMIQIAAYGFFGVVFTGTINSWWGVEMPWYVATIGLIALVQIFGYLKIEVGTKVLLVVMVLEWTVMLVMAFAILIRGGAGEGFAVSEVWSPIGLVSGAAIIGLVFAFASMFGFEASAIYGEEARNPKKAVARATVISIAMITAFFAFTGWMLIVGYGPSNAIDAAAASLQSGDPAQYVFNAGATYLGPWAPDIMSIFVITSLFACTLAFHNGIARYQYTLARDGIFPKILSRTNVHGTPYMSSFLQTGTALALIILAVITNSDPILVVFFWGSGIAVVSIVTVYILTAVAIIVYFRRNPYVDRRAWNTTIAPVLSGLILIVVLYNIVANLDVLVATPKGEALLLASTAIVAFLLGVGLYALRRRSLSPEALADLAEEVM
ncbi:MAG: APC family permease [Candidatus Nanopelagicales bacterium]|nr:APC family permease [Candidatus Nanopelagicales bacterium]